MLAALLACAASVASATDRYAVDADIRSKAEAYAHAAGLPPLDASGSDELRVWRQSYLGGRVTGYVLSRYQASRCEARVHYRDGVVAIAAAQCRRVAMPTGWQDAFPLLDALMGEDGREWHCPVLDGGGVIIEGVRGGKRIVFGVDNPSACDDPASKAVMRLLAAVP